MTEFRVGDKVTWVSQAGGHIRSKTGKVVMVVLNEYRNPPFEIADENFPNHKRMFDGWRVPGGGYKAYFVEVQAGPNTKPRLYMPYPQKLKRA